jgi:hypothetical protein
MEEKKIKMKIFIVFDEVPNSWLEHKRGKGITNWTEKDAGFFYNIPNPVKGSVCQNKFLVKFHYTLSSYNFYK